MKEIQPNQIPTADLRAVYAKDFPQARDLADLESAGANVIHPKGVKLGLAFGGAVTLASALLAACGGGDGSVSEGLPKGGSGEPKNVAVRALQALIDGDETKYLNYVRPDGRDYVGRLQDLRGCSLKNAEVLVLEEGSNSTSVKFVLRPPCGRSIVSGNPPFKVCHMDLVRLSGRWYLDPDSHCTIL